MVEKSRYIEFAAIFTFGLIREHSAHFGPPYMRSEFSGSGSGMRQAACGMDGMCGVRCGMYVMYALSILYVHISDFSQREWITSLWPYGTMD